MKRKLYALFILAGAIGALLLAYLFFFVYYTGSLTVNSNVDNYRVELFSPGTAQKWIHECPDMICVINDVSPFDYNVSIIKADYKSKLLSFKVRPRGTETLVIQLEKQVKLDSVNVENIAETSKEKIQRIRDEKLYYAKFTLDETRIIRFKDNESELLLQYVANSEVKDIQSFQRVDADTIDIKNIYSSDNVFMRMGQDNFIFDTNYFRIYRLPEIKDLRYIKYDIQSGKYIIITNVGAFVYDAGDNNLEFQYLFKDYINKQVYVIGVIFSDELQKRKNFNISEKGNVIIKYSQKDKIRKVIYSTNKPIDEIYQNGDQIFITSGSSKLELKNFD